MNSNLPEAANEEDQGGGQGAIVSTGDSESDADLTEILEALPEDQRGKFVQVIEKTVAHRGWLPMPEQLAEYEAVLPGLAERIVRLPEREQEHRHQYLDSESAREFKLKSRGQIFALLAMALILSFSAFLASSGFPKEASYLAGATIVGVVGIFATGKFFDYKTAKEE